MLHALGRLVASHADCGLRGTSGAVSGLTGIFGSQETLSLSLQVSDLHVFGACLSEGGSDGVLAILVFGSHSK